MPTTTLYSCYEESQTDTWVTIAQAPIDATLVIRHYMINNANLDDRPIRLRIVNLSDVVQTYLLSDYTAASQIPVNCTQAFIVLEPGYKLQLYAQGAGIYTSVWGGYDE